MRNAARKPRIWTDTRLIAPILAIGIVISVLVPGNIYRGWFAAAALVFSFTFVLVYSRRNWRATFAGRASMLSMSTTVIYTSNAVAILWWPFTPGTGYPHWEDVTEVVYLLLAVAALYKLMVLLRASTLEPGELEDPTTQQR